MPLEIYRHSAEQRSSCRLHSCFPHFLDELLKPIPIVIVVSILIALTDPLKALFLLPPGTFQQRFRTVAPDGHPHWPLSSRQPILSAQRASRWLDMSGWRACLISLALRRDIPSGRDHCAGAGEDGCHAADWSWDHAMVRASLVSWVATIKFCTLYVCASACRPRC